MEPIVTSSAKTSWFWRAGDLPGHPPWAVVMGRCLEARPCPQVMASTLFPIAIFLFPHLALSCVLDLNLVRIVRNVKAFLRVSSSGYTFEFPLILLVFRSH